jgi:shikimate dehydrogenase
MHNAALRALGLDTWRYQRLPLPPELFEEAVRALPRAGFKGVNVTIPHKEAALALADSATDTAWSVGAANTLTFQSGRVHADNTDVTGLLTAIPSHHDPRGRTALVLGAGGVARAAVYALRTAGAVDVMIFNRTPERAERLARELGGRVVTRVEPADIVVQCTSAELFGDAKPFKGALANADTFGAGTCAIDMAYRAGDTAFLAAARSCGADVVDGLEILVAQGAASLERWTGRPAPHDVMRQAVHDPGTE